MKIHCVEAQKFKEDEIVPYDELRKMVGFYQPQDPEGKETFWEVTTLDGGFFTCKSQFEAEVVSSLEGIKAILINQVQLREKGKEEAKKMTNELVGMMDDMGMDNALFKKLLPDLDKDKDEDKGGD